MFQFAVVATVTYSQLVSAGFYPLLNSWIRTPPVENPTQNTELLFAFLVFRHGDRTIPIETDVFYTDKSKELLAATREYGYGQLTLRGKQRAYKLGQFIRERYNELLSPKYNRSEVFIGSTEFTRTRMSVLAALAAIYPPVEPRWSETINWEPVPYTYVKILYDYNAAMLNCPKYTDNMFKLYYDCPTEMKKFSPVLKRLTQLIETDVLNYPVKVALLASVLECQQSLGIPLSHEMEELYDETKEAAAIALKYLYAQKDYLELQAGPLLKEFIDNANLVIQGNRTQRVRIHSAHDFNVYVLQVIIQATPIQGPPPFSALISLELRRDIKTGKHMVLPVYVPRPGEKPIYLHIKGCDSLPCSYDQFLEITAPYVLDEDSWRKKCEWTPDLILDKTVFQ